jgi:protein-tyrosine-phosphatase
MERLRVLFLCTGNSARSQIAEALFRKLSRGRADVFSAGVSPATEVHPLALELLESRFSVDTADLFPKHLDRFRGDRFDYVITVCDRTAETCPRSPEIRSESTGVSTIPSEATGRRRNGEPLSLLPTVSPRAFESGWRFPLCIVVSMRRKSRCLVSIARHGGAAGSDVIYLAPS